MRPAACASRVAKISSIAVLSPSLSRAWMTIGRPRSTRPRSGRGRRAAGRRARRCRGRSRARSRRSRAPCRGRRARRAPPAPCRRTRPRRWDGDRSRRRPPRWPRRRDDLGVGRPSSPTFSIRTTPAASAASSSSAVGFSQRKRWVWESITGPPYWLFLGARSAKRNSCGLAAEGRERGRGGGDDEFQQDRDRAAQLDAPERGPQCVAWFVNPVACVQSAFTSASEATVSCSCVGGDALQFGEHADQVGVGDPAEDAFQA